MTRPVTVGFPLAKSGASKLPGALSFARKADRPATVPQPTATSVPPTADEAEDEAGSTRAHPQAATGVSAQAWSFERIYDEFKTPIYNYIYHLVGNREQADDLTQDTFMKAFKALPKMDASLKLSAWLYRIATNTAYDALRRRKLIAWMPWQDLDHEPADVESADPQETIGTSELVKAALRRMPRHYRAALLLYTQEGFSYAEIASTLNIAESGVKMYLSRARHSFREHYRALEQGGGVGK